MKNFNNLISRVLKENQTTPNIDEISVRDLITMSPQDSEKVKLIPFVLAKAYTHPGSAVLINSAINRLQSIGIDIDKQEIVFAAKKIGIKIDAEYLRRINPSGDWVNDMLNKKEFFDTSKDYKQQAKDLFDQGKKAAKKIIDKSQEKLENLPNMSAGLSSDTKSILDKIPRTRTDAVYGPKIDLVGKIGARTPPRY